MNNTLANFRAWWGIFCFTGVWLPSLATASSPTLFSSLDYPGATATYAYGVSNSGEVVGAYQDVKNIQHAFVYTAGQYKTIDPPNATYAIATGINDVGQIVGQFGAAGQAHGFLLASVASSNYLQIDYPNAIGATWAYGINNSGVITGKYYLNSGPISGTPHIGYNAFQLSAGAYLTPDVPGSDVEAHGINDAGQIVGTAPEGFLFDHGAYTAIAAPAPHTATIPYGINDDGQVVGSYLSGTATLGFLWANGVFSFLPIRALSTYPDVEPHGISNNKVIVGTYSDGHGGVHGFLYTGLATTSSPPANTTSYYVQTQNSQQLIALGQACGLQQTGTDSAVVLLFGGPRLRGGQYGATGFRGFVSTSQIALLIQDFVTALYYSLGNDRLSHVRVIISTSNSGSDGDVSYQHGAAWATMVDHLATWANAKGYSAQVDIAGGDDIETGYSSPQTAKNWVAGYASVHPQRYLYYVGEAGGCPRKGSMATPGSCNAGWTQEDIWSASWGTDPVIPLPQIYSTTGSNAAQWANLSLYSHLAHGTAMRIAGALTQNGACLQTKNCIGTDNTPAQGWQQVFNALNADVRTSQSVQWSTDVLHFPH